MLIKEGDFGVVKYTSLPKGTYVKLQPHTTDFLDVSNPKAVWVHWVANTKFIVRIFIILRALILTWRLERVLRSYSCLTTGGTIVLPYNDKKYYVDIVETKPSAAVCIIETDCEVDFAPPLDYKEPEYPQGFFPFNHLCFFINTFITAFFYLKWKKSQRRRNWKLGRSLAQEDVWMVSRQPNKWRQWWSSITQAMAVERLALHLLNNNLEHLFLVQTWKEIERYTPLEMLWLYFIDVLKMMLNSCVFSWQEKAQDSTHKEKEEEGKKFKAFTGKKYLLKDNASS